MTNQQRVAELEAKALPIPSRIDLLRSAMVFCRTHPDMSFNLFHGVELMSDAEIRALKVAGTTLEPISMMLAAAGVQTDGTVGNLLDLQALDPSDVHVLTCDCHIGESSIPGVAMALVFQARTMHD